jgi:DNA invertase Pin-like site-specific DNA recombinase
MAKVKYIRVSSEEQNIGRQNNNAKDFSKVYIDKVSGTVLFSQRKEAKKLLRDINAGLVKEVHVSSIDRLGRNILDILTVIERLNEKSVSLFVENIGMYSLADGKLNPAFKMIISVLGNVAEMERECLRERQKQGIEIAKAKGIYTGRRYGSKMTDEKMIERYRQVVKELTENGQSIRRAAKLGGCSFGTAIKIKRIIGKEKVVHHVESL